VEDGVRDKRISVFGVDQESVHVENACPNGWEAASKSVRHSWSCGISETYSFLPADVGDIGPMVNM